MQVNCDHKSSRLVELTYPRYAVVQCDDCEEIFRFGNPIQSDVVIQELPNAMVYGEIKLKGLQLPNFK